MHVPTQSFEIDGVTLAWDAWGEPNGTDLVLVHGYTGSMHEFEPHLAPLSTSRRVLAIDHAGHGCSGRFDDADQYRVSRLAEHCAAWLTATADGPVDLLGHSMGGRVVLEVALGWPHLIRSLILMDTTPWSFAADDPAEREPFLSILRSLRSDTSLGPQHPIEGDEGEMTVAASTTEWRARRDEVWSQLDPIAAREFGLELFDDRLLPLGDRLGEIAVPTTVLVGELDAHYLAHAPEIVDGVQHGRLAVIDGAHHSPQLTHPAEWRRAIEEHLAALESP